MNVKNTLHDKCTHLIDFLKKQISDLERINADLHNQPESWMFNQENTRQHNLRCIENYLNEIIELEDLRDGHITLEQLGTARRFFNRLPEWATYGT